VTPRYTESQLDALLELANIASGNAATALSQMLGREVGLSVPRVLALPVADAIEACGSPAGSEIGDSALREIGNILGTSCLNALASMTGLTLGPCPPHLTTDILGAIVSSLALTQTPSTDLVLVLDSELEVADEPCSISFVLLPTDGGVTDLLTPLGLAA
jgi:chemotaxis protein CheC